MTSHHSRLKRLSKEGFWVVSGQAVSLAGTVVSVRLLTELLDPPTYGELALALTVVALINQSLFGPLAQGASRFYSVADRANERAAFWGSVKEFTRGTSSIIALGSIVVASVCFFFGGSASPLLVLLLGALGLCMGSNSVIAAVQNAARRRVLVAAYEGLLSWLRLIAAVVSILLFGPTVVSALGGYVLATLVIAVSQAISGRSLSERAACFDVRLNHDWRWRLWSYSWPFAAWGVFYWAHMASDRWGLELAASTYTVGLYAALLQVGYQPIQLFSMAVQKLLAPVVFQRAGSGDNPEMRISVRKLIDRCSALAVTSTAFVFLVAFAVHGPAFDALVAREYASISYLLPWMVLSGGLFAVGQIASLRLMADKKTGTIMLVTVSASTFGVAANFLGARYFGVHGVVLASIAFSALYCCGMIFSRVFERE